MQNKAPYIGTRSGCSVYGKWMDQLRAGYTAEEANISEEGAGAETNAIDKKNTEVEVDAVNTEVEVGAIEDDADGTFTRLICAGLI